MTQAYCFNLSKRDITRIRNKKKVEVLRCDCGCNRELKEDDLVVSVCESKERQYFYFNCYVKIEG